MILFNYQLACADGSVSMDVDKIDSLRQILEGNGGRLCIGFGTIDGLPDKVDETEAVDAFGLDGDTVVSRVGEEFDAVVSLCSSWTALWPSAQREARVISSNTASPIWASPSILIPLSAAAFIRSLK